MKVSFSGIHDIRFPYGTSTDVIKQRQVGIQNFINKEFPEIKDTISLSYKDSFSVQKSEEKLAKDGLRIVTPYENPYLIASILNSINTELLQQYINQTKTELIMPV